MGKSLKISRSSVCAGDDLDSHEVYFPFTEGETLKDIVSRVAASAYLASISGGKATWIVEVGPDPLAVVAQQWTKPRFILDADKKMVSDLEGSQLYFNYWCQVDPDIVYECLRDGKPLPDRYGR